MAGNTLRRRLERGPRPSKSKQNATRRDQYHYRVSPLTRGFLLRLIIYMSLGWGGLMSLHCFLKYGPFRPHHVMKMSQIIRLNVDICQQLVANEEELKSFLVEDPLFLLIKTKLRSVQERVASLRTQTSQYEKMEYISGGPTHFMSTSLKELGKIETEQMGKLHDEVISILLERSVFATTLGKNSSLIVRANAMAIRTELLGALMKEGIHIAHLDIYHGAADESLYAETNFQDVIALYLDLATMYENLEARKIEVDALREHLAIEEQDGQHYEEVGSGLPKALLDLVEGYVSYHSEIKKVIYKNRLKYPLLTRFKMKAIKSTEILVNRLTDYETEKRRVYFSLYEMLMNDIRQLRVRIQNLKYRYNYSKKSTA